MTPFSAFCRIFRMHSWFLLIFSPKVKRNRKTRGRMFPLNNSYSIPGTIFLIFIFQRNLMEIGFLPRKPKIFLNSFPQFWKILPNLAGLAKKNCQDLSKICQKSHNFPGKKTKTLSDRLRYLTLSKQLWMKRPLRNFCGLARSPIYTSIRKGGLIVAWEGQLLLWFIEQAHRTKWIRLKNFQLSDLIF